MAQKPRNPFVHHHDHPHDDEHGHDPHHHGEGEGHDHRDHAHPAEELDPAQQSLADALRVSFGVLKLIMLVLLVLYLFSGFFSVATNEVALRLRFGRIVGEDRDAVVVAGKGFHFAWPYPIEEVVKIPVTTQQLPLDREFWTEGASLEETQAGPLDPEKSGSLLTGDANIIHARWAVSYKVAEPRAAEFVRYVGTMKRAEDLVRRAAEQGIIYAVAHRESDALMRGDAANAVSEAARRDMQHTLDAMHTGLEIQTVSAARVVMPAAVKPAFDDVIKAQADKAVLVEAAERERGKALVDTAGEGHAALWDLVREYQKRTALGDAAWLAANDKVLNESFRKLQMPEALGGRRITGQVSTIINEANTYRQSVAREVEAEANQFLTLYQTYADKPELRRIIMNRMWLDAREAILSSIQVETIYSPTGRVTLWTSPDPNVVRIRERDKLQREQPRRGPGTGVAGPPGGPGGPGPSAAGGPPGSPPPPR